MKYGHLSACKNILGVLSTFSATFQQPFAEKRFNFYPKLNFQGLISTLPTDDWLFCGLYKPEYQLRRLLFFMHSSLQVALRVQDADVA